LTRFVAVTFLPYFYRTHGYVIVKTGPDDSDEAASSSTRHTESTLCEPRTRGWRFLAAPNFEVKNSSRS
jgi:hypothetical protein